MSLKNEKRDNNVDKTRSTMQQKVNILHKLLGNQMMAAQRKNRKVRQLTGFIYKLIATGVINKQEFKTYKENGKSRIA
jgi:hypothetical protein